jgi:hypothetical protein
VYWQTLTHLEIVRRAKADADRLGAELQLAAERCIKRDFDDESRRLLVGSWCSWRNAVDEEIRQADEFMGRGDVIDELLQLRPCNDQRGCRVRVPIGSICDNCAQIRVNEGRATWGRK